MVVASNSHLMMNPIQRFRWSIPPTMVFNAVIVVSANIVVFVVVLPGSV
jgi:hypothetical protein